MAEKDKNASNSMAANGENPYKSMTGSNENPSKLKKKLKLMELLNSQVTFDEHPGKSMAVNAENPGKSMAVNTENPGKSMAVNTENPGKLKKKLKLKELLHSQVTFVQEPEVNQGKSGLLPFNAGSEDIEFHQSTQNSQCEYSTTPLVLHKPEMSSESIPSKVFTQEQAKHSSQKSSSKGLRWVEDKHSHIGYFFFNKLYYDKDKTRHWEPYQSANGQTSILSFEDLSPFQDLEHALFVTDNVVEHSISTLVKFPSSVSINLVCHDRESSCASVRRSGYYAICPDHGCLELQRDETCSCELKRDILLTIPPNASAIRANVMLLRYKTYLRVIICSASLTQFSWTYLAHFGWYNDFKITEQGESSDFKSTLEEFLFELKVDAQLFLVDADFSSLSNMVQLITSLYGEYDDYMFGRSKLQFLMDDFGLPVTNNYMDILVTNKVILNRWQHLQGIKSLFNIGLPGKFVCDRKQRLMIVYPSEEQIQRTILNIDGLKREDIKSHVLKYHDDRFDCLDYLHTSPYDVIPATKIYLKCTSLENSGLCGWLMFGSHSPNDNSLGLSRNGRSIYKRIEASIAILPRLSSDGKTVQCVNLAKLDLPCSDLKKYSQREIPFMQKDDKHLRCLVKCVREKAAFCFLEDIAPNDLKRYYDPVPLITDNLYKKQTSVFLHYDTFRKFNPRRNPQHGDILDLIVEGNENRNRAVRVLGMFASIGGVYAKLGIPQPSARSILQTKIQSSKSEEDIDKYMVESELMWCSANKYKKRPDVNTEYPLTPWKLPDDMDWLERTFNRVHGSNRPECFGPYSIRHMLRAHDYHRKMHVTKSTSKLISTS